MRSKPLKTLLNSVWKKIGPNRSSQLSPLPTVDKPITISRHGEDYKAKNNLCARCGNHSDNDSSPCDLHPLYKNIKNDDRLILGCELTSLLNSTSIVALSSHSVKRPRSSPVSNIIEEHLPQTKRDAMERSSHLASHSHTVTTEVVAMDKSLRTVTVTIDTRS